MQVLPLLAGTASTPAASVTCLCGGHALPGASKVQAKLAHLLPFDHPAASQVNERAANMRLLAIQTTGIVARCSLLTETGLTRPQRAPSSGARRAARAQEPELLEVGLPPTPPPSQPLCSLRDLRSIPRYHSRKLPKSVPVVRSAARAKTAACLCALTCAMNAP